MPETPNKKARILVVDDEESNLRLISAMLAPQDYEVILATDGPKALDMAAKSKPDVVLLDVMMPGLSGFDVCQRLKANPSTAPIPVLLVTSLHQRENRLSGMEAGANDFVTKPIDKEDMLLRVKNAAYAKRLYDELGANYEKLKELEKLRDNLTHMIVHDLRSPLTGVCGYLQMIPKEALGPKYARYLEKSLEAVAKLSEMINILFDVSRLEEGKLPVNKRPCNIKTLIHEVIESLGAINNKCNFKYEAPDNPVIINCDPDIIIRVFAHLLGNAIKFSPSDEIIIITIADAGGCKKVSITDKGPGVAVEYHQKIFEKFGPIEMRKQKHMHSTGLGLTFCKLAVEAHGGKIGIISGPEKGSTFWFTLPV